MWQTKNNALYKKFEFKDFNEAFSFMVQVAALAEVHQHHPKWTNEWNTVEIWLSTHDAGNKVTPKDKKLAEAIDDVIKKPLINRGPAEAKLYTDGGSRGNPGPAASGYVILGMDDKVLRSRGVYLGETTNNQAEYQALRLGLDEARQMGVKKIHVFMDSQLVVNQLKGVYKQKNLDLKPHFDHINGLAGAFEAIDYNFIPRELNKLADAEVNKALDKALE